MLDANWRIEEALMALRDGVHLDPPQEARLQHAEAGGPDGGGLRGLAASLLAGLARRLDAESAKAAVWRPEAPDRRAA